MNKEIIKKYASKLSGEWGRKVGIAEAESEIIRIIQEVSHALAPSYRFGYHTLQDIEQQGIIEALEVLSSNKYNQSRPLENFLHVHLRNRLSNYRRKHYMRFEAPCSCCDPLQPPASPCQKWLDWKNRNIARQNLMRPLDMTNVDDEFEKNMK